MRMYADRLAESLKNLAPVYVVSGDEPLLVQEACDLIRSAARAEGYLERQVFHLEAGFNRGELDHAMNNRSLFSDRKVLEVRMTSPRPGDAGAKALVSVVEQAGGDRLLLVVMPRVDASTRKTKWFKAVEALAVFVQVWPIDAGKFPRWLNDRLRRAGLRASRDAVVMLADRTEGNLLAAVQEIERLKLVAGEKGEVDAALVAGSVADSARFDVFNLMDAALAGNSLRVSRMTRGLRSEGVEVLYLVNMLARELRSLEGMATSLLQGASVKEVVRKARVFEKRKGIVAGCLERNSLESLRSALLSLGQVDRMVKGIIGGDPWRGLTGVLLGLSGVTRQACPGSLAEVSRGS